MSDEGWFTGLGSSDDGADRIRDGSAADHANWPSIAIESGIVADKETYYDRLHEAAMTATRAEVASREQADDQQLIHAIRALDDCRRTANELAERLGEWAGTVDADAGVGLEYAKTLAASEPTPGQEPIVSLARRVADLAAEADDLEQYVDQRAPVAAPNLSALAGPVLAARLISLAGGLEALAKKPSGTVQVLGAEEALFAHLRGHASSPKHGILFTHEAVRGTRLEDRGSAARALAGKLSIAARIDHYSGDYRPELEAELTDRIETIQARGTGDTETTSDTDTETDAVTNTGGDDDD